MSKKDKKKLCWNCEGAVSHSTKNCPFCGVYLHPTEETWDEEETIDVEPPYSPSEEIEETLPSSSKEKKPYTPPLNNEIRTILVPLTLFIMGSLFLFFSLLLFFFSHEGTLTIRWNASYWFLYLLLSIPLLFIGWHFLDPETPSSQEKSSENARKDTINQDFPI